MGYTQPFRPTSRLQRKRGKIRNALYGIRSTQQGPWMAHSAVWDTLYPHHVTGKLRRSVRLPFIRPQSWLRSRKQLPPNRLHRLPRPPAGDLPPQLVLRVYGFPHDVNVHQVVQLFNQWGPVHMCRLYPKDALSPTSTVEATVRYRPPPLSALDYFLSPQPAYSLTWGSCRLTWEVRNYTPQPALSNNSQVIPSPWCDHPLVLSVQQDMNPVFCSQFHLGVLLEPRRYLSEWCTTQGAKLLFQPNKQKLMVYFLWLGKEYRMVIHTDDLAGPIKITYGETVEPALKQGHAVDPQCSLVPNYNSPCPSRQDQPTFPGSKPQLTSSTTADDREVSAAKQPHYALVQLLIRTSRPPSFWGNSFGTTDMDTVWFVGDSWKRITSLPLNNGPAVQEDPMAPITTGVEDDHMNFGQWCVYHLTVPVMVDPGVGENGLVPTPSAMHILWHVNQLNVRQLRRQLKQHRLVKLVNQKAFPKLVAKAGEMSVMPRLIRLGSRLAPEVHYMLETLVSHTLLSEYNLTQPFMERLEKLPSDTAVRALGMFFSRQGRIYTPARELERIVRLLGPSLTLSSPTTAGSTMPTTPSSTMLVRKVVVTPTKIYLLPPQQEVSNRVLREFSFLQHHFLRVTFTDENLQRLDTNVLVSGALFRRLYRALRHGIVLCGLHYKFLAFSASQLREQSCWFFAPEKDSPATTTPLALPLEANGHRRGHPYPVTADYIRSWMGDFSGIHIIAKVAARMGQCFSTTSVVRSIHDTDLKVIPDVKANGHVFSDGVGLVSPDVLNHVTRVQYLDKPPAAFQFRLGGYKGVLAVAPWLTQPNRLCLRPSQNKFPCPHQMLEFVRPATYTPCFLNRQIIILLNALGIPTEVFLQLLRQTMARYDQCLSNAAQAVDLLKSQSGRHAPSRFAMDAITAGFFQAQDPFVLSFVRCFRSAMLKSLKQKARIPIAQGVRLMGVLDEKGVLQENEIFVQFRDPRSSSAKMTIITEYCVITRNPCFHPGDVRVVRAVDHPELHYLYDVVVFPARGKRDLASQLCGGDLDGDEYTVIWDPVLVPKDKYTHPVPSMDYTPPPPLTEDSVTIRHIQRFFVDYIISDNLGQIANAHLVHADRSPHGVRDPKCLQLAQLHSLAVDYPKTGRAAELDPKLRPREYPDFMEKPDKCSYRSTGVLGHLYRAVRWKPPRQSFLTSEAESTDTNYQSSSQSRDQATEPVDDPQTDEETLLGVLTSPACQALLRRMRIEGFERYVEEARTLLYRYNADLAALLYHYGLTSEQELIGGIPLRFSRLITRSEYQMQETLARLSEDLRNEYRTVFYSGLAGLSTSDSLSSSEMKKVMHTPAVLAKAAAWYYVTYHPSERYGTDRVAWDSELADLFRTAGVASPAIHMPKEHWLFLSFPWCVTDVLCQLLKRSNSTGLTTGMPLVSVNKKSTWPLPVTTVVKPGGSELRRPSGSLSLSPTLAETEDSSDSSNASTTGGVVDRDTSEAELRDFFMSL
ncbi:hypothetical protein IWQ61_003356 [Dispira simplex]|nr:hypothetical protein IWQ61_003356 [Dispira simplex]